MVPTVYKSSLILVLLVLFGAFSAQVAGQTTGTKNQPLTNITNPNDPIRAVPIVLPASTEGNAEADRLYREGLKLAEAAQFSHAAEAFQQAIRLDTEYADAYSALGRAYFKMRQWQKAVDNLRRAAELHAKERERQDVLHQQLEIQKRKESSIPGKTNSTPLQIEPQQATNANSAGVKTLRPESAPPLQPERRQETGAAVKAAATLPETRQQPANTNATGVKTWPQPERQKAGAPVKAPVPNPDVKQPTANANATGVKTLPQPERRQEAGPVRAPATNPETKQSATNANATGVKTLQPQSNPTAQPERRQASDIKSNAASTNPESKQQVNKATVAWLKTLLPAPEAWKKLDQPGGAVGPLKSDDGNGLNQRQEPVGVRASMNLTLPPQPLETKSASPISTNTSNDEVSLTNIYRVGPNDVLDVRLNDSQSAKSTLFTVMASGLIEYPMLNEPLLVAGLTVEEIGAKIEDELNKRALIEDPKVIVGVRDYASHAILVSGLVKEPGTKFLRREAIPLYVVVADAQPAPEAARLVLVRNERHQIYEIDLMQVVDMNLLVRQGDVVTLHPSVTQFIYVGGEVKTPGEKMFRRGLTLTQAIITAGGIPPKCKFAEIGRDDGHGFLIETRFDLKDIESGKVADPLLRPGDRIMIMR